MTLSAASLERGRGWLDFCETADVSERGKPSGYLTQGLETSPEGARQLNQYGYLYALLGLVAVVVIGVGLFLWLA